MALVSIKNRLKRKFPQECVYFSAKRPVPPKRIAFEMGISLRLCLAWELRMRTENLGILTRG